MSIDHGSEPPEDPRERALYESDLALIGVCLAIAEGLPGAAAFECMTAVGFFGDAGMKRESSLAADAAVAIRKREAIRKRQAMSS